MNIYRRITPWRYQVHDWWELSVTGYVCKVIGHKKPYQKKFKGELLCPRCSAQVGWWTQR